MLGSRTKQVVAYGKRPTRIVNLSEDPGHSITKDEDSASSRVQSRTKVTKRENIHHHHRTSSPIAAHAFQSRQKRGKPSASSPAIENRLLVRRETQDKHLSKESSARWTTPPRRPLGLHPQNVLRSPSVPGNVRRKTKRRLSLKLAAPYSPLVDVDILVIDDQGNLLSREKRVSKPCAQVNPVVQETKGVTRTLPSGRVGVVELDDDEEDFKPVKRGNKHGVRRVVLSDDSDNDSLEGLLSYAERIKSTPNNIFIHSDDSSSDSERKRLPSLETILQPQLGKPSASRKPTRHPPVSNSTHEPRPIQRVASRPPPSPPLTRGTRKLTPIRRGNFSKLPPSPSSASQSSIDLTLDFDELSMSIKVEEQPAFLLPLLKECEQDSPHEFSAFIEVFPLDPLVHSTSNLSFRKIGEASYSEVFGIGEVVLKVIPIRLENDFHSNPWKETPPPSDAKDILRELTVTRAMGEMCDGFVKLLKGYIVKGRYPSLFLDLWDEYAELKGSESIRPDSFKVSQLYAILVLQNGGPDLEAYAFGSPGKAGWRQACSIFWQVAKALANAEDLVSFEHRDLHWGQVLVKNLPVPEASKKRKAVTPKSLPMDHLSHGVQVTLIDLGMSRMDANDGSLGDTVLWMPLDEEIFHGEGDYQFDIYRMMREATGGDWRAFHPLTNVMWLHYLSVKLIRDKKLRQPALNGGDPKGSRKPALNAVRSEKECWKALTQVEQLMGRCLEPYRPKKPAGKGRRKPIEEEKQTMVQIGSAMDLKKWGIRKGWLDD